MRSYKSERPKNVDQHLAHGVPDLRLHTLPGLYEDLLRDELPITSAERTRLQRYAERFGQLESCAIPPSIQHDDLHHANLYVRNGSLRVLDWGDASVGHPFASLVVTFRFLEERTGLAPGDAWFTRLRDAYLEPWGSGLGHACGLALRVGAFARAMAYPRQRAVLTREERRRFDPDFATVLRRAISQTRN